MRKFLAGATLLALAACLGGHPAYAYSVYAGCATPPAVSTGKTWYVDPVNGKTPAAGGLGTQAAPWNSLAGISGSEWGASLGVAGYTRPLLSSIPYPHWLNATVGWGMAADLVGNPPVSPGDNILLMSGNYGDVAVGNYMGATVNSDWITVSPAPGQSPVFTTLNLRSTNKWVFSGIKVQSVWGTNKNTAALVTVSDQGASFPTSDIILQNLTISTADSTLQWPQAQWVAQGRTGLIENSTPGNGSNGQPNLTCVSVTNSHIFNVRAGAGLYANNSLFSGNTIDHFGDDGIDYSANDIAITHNSVHDNFSIGDGNHEDGMQGVIGPIAAGVPVNHYSNILIDSNSVIRQTDPKIAFPTYLQGIDAFDADWTNVTVTNNVVVTGACQGIALSSIHSSLIAGNTVMNDPNFVSAGCTAAIEVGGLTHEGTASTNVRVTSNLANKFSIQAQGDTAVTYDNNVATTAGAFGGYNSTTGQLFYNVPAGVVDANGNFSPAVSYDLTKVFAVWSPSTFTYDFHLIAGSPAIGRGVGIPALDSSGVVRVPVLPPITVGAYAFPSP